MMKKILILGLMAAHFMCFGQNYRYTATLFPSSTPLNNVVYGSAPFINGPFYTVESSTTTLNLLMDIYKPTGDVFSLRPAIIFAHSGGFLTGSKNVDDMKALCDSFARKGYVTASMDYRQGFNVFTNVNLHSTRAVYRGLQDGRTAVRYLRANAALYGIDPNKIYFVGSSAGSFIALHAIYLDAVSEIPAETTTTPSLGGLDIGDNLTFNGKPDAVISMWGGIQNTNLITADNNTPVFLVHGSTDPTVPFNTGSPFGYPALPQTDGSNPINNKLDALGFTNKETYFVDGKGHEFYGTSNGTWSNGTGGNTYLPIIVDKSAQFLWKQHKPVANYSLTQNGLSVAFTNTSTGSLAWWWDFGDGTFSNAPNPTHIYTTSGNYQVKLYIENDIKSWDETTKSVTLSVISLSLLDFEATLRENKSLLKWTTADEINTSHFEVEHSMNSMKWQTLGSKPSSNLSGINTYTFMDENLLVGINYYRLKMIDKDGKFTYSPIKSIDANKKKADFLIVPNPTKGNIDIKWDKNYDRIKYQIYDISGRIIAENQLTNNGATVSIDAFTNGLYFIKCSTESSTQVIKVIKQ
jgi:PKD repeat protein